MPICNVVNTPVFLICVLLHAYYPRHPQWPLRPACVFLLFGPICYVFMTGENNICLCLHQLCAMPLFLWAYRQRETVTQSVAKGMYYIMAQFFAVWCSLKVDAQNTPTPSLTWALLHWGIIPPHKLQTTHWPI